MSDAPSHAHTAPGHLPVPRSATMGVAAKWKALLFMAGVLVLFPVALIPANWLSARGLLQEPAALAAARHWGLWLAVLVPTMVAAWYEGSGTGLAFGRRGRVLRERASPRPPRDPRMGCASPVPLTRYKVNPC
ncbi:MAG: hypothetical protein R2712_27105 [Vicinamibacterales bacterium]